MQLEPLPFSKLMGITVVSVTPDLVIGELKVREDLCTRPAVLHGGAYMAFADTIGAVATVANLKEGETTTTIESKTNFFAAIPLGDTARAECTPLHKGRTTMVWQTKITRGDGRLAALVTQTQMVLKRNRSPHGAKRGRMEECGNPHCATLHPGYAQAAVTPAIPTACRDRRASPADRRRLTQQIANTTPTTIVVQISFASSAGTVGAPGSCPGSTVSPASAALRTPNGSTANSTTHQMTK